MAGPTQRCETACQRIGFNPILHGSHCGFIDNGGPCRKQIDLNIRKIAYYMIGHGAHLTAQSAELHGILTEAADLLACCKEHIRSDQLVKKWLVDWQKSTPSIDVGKDKPLSHTLTRDRRVVSRISQTASAERDADNLGEYITLAGQLERRMQAVREGQNHQDRERTVSAPQESLGAMQEQEPMCLGTPMVRERILSHGVFYTPLPSLPPLPERAEAHFPAVTYLDRVDQVRRTTPVLSASSSLIERLLGRREGSILYGRRPVVVPSSELAIGDIGDAPTTKPLAKRSKTFLTVGNASYRALTQKLGSPTVLPTPVEDNNQEAKMMPRTEPSSFPRSTGIATRGMSAVEAIATQNAGATRPSLTLRTTFSTVSVSSSSSSSPPERVVTTTPVTSAKQSSVVPAKTSKPFLSLVEDSTDASRDDCKICFESFDVNNTKKTWTCPQCKGQVHRECFEEWNRQNIRWWFRPTPCPFCRHAKGRA